MAQPSTGDIEREELHRACIGNTELSHPLAQYRANQDVDSGLMASAAWVFMFEP